MAYGPDVTDDDPSMGQGGPPPDPSMGGGGAPPSPPGGGAAGPGMMAYARSRMGPQPSAPGPGNQADAMNKIIQAINLLKVAGLGLSPGDKIHADVFKTIQTLSRHIGGAGSMGPAAGIQKTMIGDQMRDTVKNMLLSRILASKGQQVPGAPPDAPMPSTPQPGT